MATRDSRDAVVQDQDVTSPGYQRQSELADPILGSADAAEGIRAFAEHRDPVWRER